jgi:hypothetical protein
VIILFNEASGLESRDLFEYSSALGKAFAGDSVTEQANTLAGKPGADWQQTPAIRLA